MRSSTIGLAFIGALLAPALLGAQVTPAKPGRIAGIAPPPPAPPPPQAAIYPPPGQFLYGSIPVVVFPDGRVYADFGYGYEQITRACSTQQYTTPQNQGAVQPRVTQPQPGVTPTTSPAPQQQQTSGPCWTTDSRGQFTVRR